MTNMTAARLGQVNKAGDTKALFIKESMAEIIAAYDETNVMDALHVTRTIESGKSAGFPVTGKISARFHTPGEFLMGNQSLGANEIIIAVDDLLVSDAFIANIDEAMSHVDYRSEYTRQIGQALARAKDRRALQTALLAARSPSIVTGMPGGSTIIAADARTDGEVLAAAISNAAVALDEKDVPMADRSAIFKPAQTHLLAMTPNVIHKDLGGDGSVSTGYIGSYDNVKVVKSNNVPTGVVGADAGEMNVYDGDFTNTVGVVMNRGAIGTVKLMDLSVEMTSGDFAVAYQGTLLVGKYLQGTGKLRADSAVEIAVA